MLLIINIKIMKTFAWSFLLSLCSVFSSISAPKHTNNIIIQEENRTAIINKNTTEKEFEELIIYFSESNIKIDISEVNYNASNEITGIKIILQKGTQKSQYSASSNIPISDLEVGIKNGQLFARTIGRSTSFNNISSLLQQFSSSSINIDSLLQGNSFSLTFGSNDLRQLLGGDQFDIDALQKQFFDQFEGSKKESSNSKENTDPQSKTLPKYNFINSNSKVKKLIIIDGKEATFEKLNELAQNNKLDIVDNLKPATAISIYGKKAKYGAIIVTTLK